MNLFECYPMSLAMITGSEILEVSRSLKQNSNKEKPLNVTLPLLVFAKASRNVSYLGWTVTMVLLYSTKDCHLDLPFSFHS